MATRTTATPLRKKYGPWAIVVGCAEGLGAAYAERLAGDGFCLVLADMNAPKLKELAKRLQAEHGIETRSVTCNLAQPRQVRRLLDSIDDLEIGLLVFNAAAGAIGPWKDLSLEAKLVAVQVNVVSVLQVTDVLSRKMIKRRRGGIILTSSMAALQGAPGQAVYAATKSFDLILAESLWAELREYKVDVLGLIPGMVKTPNFERSGASSGQGSLLDAVEPAVVVEEALGALGQKASTIPGWKWKAAAAASSLVPRQKMIDLVGQRMKGLKKSG